MNRFAPLTIHSCSTSELGEAGLPIESLAASGLTSHVPELVRSHFNAEDRDSAALVEFAELLQLFFKARSLRGRFDTYFLLMRWLGQADEHVPLPLDEDPLSPLARNPRWRRSHVMRLLIVRSPELRTLFAGTLGSSLATRQ